MNITEYIAQSYLTGVSKPKSILPREDEIPTTVKIGSRSYGKLIGNMGAESQTKIIFIPGLLHRKFSQEDMGYLNNFSSYLDNSEFYFFGWNAGSFVDMLLHKEANFIDSLPVFLRILWKMLPIPFNMIPIPKNLFQYILPPKKKDDLSDKIKSHLISYWNKTTRNAYVYSLDLIKEINRIWYNEKHAKIILIGHSLGCRLIYNALKRNPEFHKTLYKIFLCGGAVNIKAPWENLGKVRVENNWTKKDLILSTLYVQAEYFSIPIGLGNIEGVENIINNNLTEYVDGHSDYFSSKYNIDSWFSIKSKKTSKLKSTC